MSEPATRHERLGQAVQRAHLRSLPACRCGRPATKALYNGLNAQLGVYCSRCAPAALKRFKEQA